jgi:hypothetical protein
MAAWTQPWWETTVRNEANAMPPNTDDSFSFKFDIKQGKWVFPQDYNNSMISTYLDEGTIKTLFDEINNLPTTNVYIYGRNKKNSLTCDHILWSILWTFIVYCPTILLIPDHWYIYPTSTIGWFCIYGICVIGPKEAHLRENIYKERKLQIATVVNKFQKDFITDNKLVLKSGNNYGWLQILDHLGLRVIGTDAALLPNELWGECSIRFKKDAVYIQKIDQIAKKVKILNIWELFKMDNATDAVWYNGSGMKWKLKAKMVDGVTISIYKEEDGPSVLFERDIRQEFFGEGEVFSVQGWGDFSANYIENGKSLALTKIGDSFVRISTDNLENLYF